MKSDGSVELQNITIPATSRSTIYVNDVVPNESISTKIESTNGVKVIAERAMYWDVLDQTLCGGHSSMGIK